jgi:hypothetical protein
MNGPLLPEMIVVGKLHSARLSGVQCDSVGERGRFYEMAEEIAKAS